MRVRYIVSLLTLISLALSVSPIAQAAALPAGSIVDGKTIGEWTADWWKWALSYPPSNNPVLDTTGESASLGDMGSVFFLAGTFSPDAVHRNFAVPSGKYILIPLINGFMSAEGTEAEMRERLATYVVTINGDSLHASVNGVAIPNLSSHREVSPVFDIALPADNIFGAPEGTYTPSVSDGYWIMLEPLAPGNHVIRFGGRSEGSTDPTFPDLTVDISYAVPEPGTFALSLAAAAAFLFVRCRY